MLKQTGLHERSENGRSAWVAALLALMLKCFLSYTARNGYNPSLHCAHRVVLLFKFTVIYTTTTFITVSVAGN